MRTCPLAFETTDDNPQMTHKSTTGGVWVFVLSNMVKRLHQVHTHRPGAAPPTLPTLEMLFATSLGVCNNVARRNEGTWWGNLRCVGELQSAKTPAVNLLTASPTCSTDTRPLSFRGPEMMGTAVGLELLGSHCGGSLDLTLISRLEASTEFPTVTSTTSASYSHLQTPTCQIISQ
ncbi:hypothetical protein BD779DRAFT_1482077 [Infundibulicybe gibba]|nr:hypothetical protein BD779DRAFT_1482077 [Infundibulicybe gibba]